MTSASPRALGRGFAHAVVKTCHSGGVNGNAPLLEPFQGVAADLERLRLGGGQPPCEQLVEGGAIRGRPAHARGRRGRRTRREA